MISRIIAFSIENRLVTLLAIGALCVLGVYCLYRTPVDAIPDLSENQVIVWADWPGRSPREIEDQITYPLSVNLQGLAGVKSIRATSEFGFSMINIIFEERIDFYFARMRVLERLSIAGSFLPAGVVPYLAPDATALGQIFWYTVEGEGRSLDELRSIQDWYVRWALNSVSGVAQVASVGGHIREYQIDISPERLRAFDISLGEVFEAVMSSNSSVGGKVVQKEGSEFLVRGFGWIRGIEDVRDIVVTERGGVPITVDRLGSVQFGPAFRRAVLEKDGREAVGGVVMMRWGENPLEVTEAVKAKIREIQPGLPPGVRVVPFYDRTGLIEASIETLTRTLIEEIAIATLVVLLVLAHLRSAFVICLTLPIAVLLSFVAMYWLDVPSNIMSLSGIAISIGVLVDAGIVMTENAYHRLHDRFQGAPVTGDTRPIVREACQLVGGPLFFSILIMLLSFAPVFVLGGIEGKMFHPLAFTKTFALVGVAILAITLLPAIIPSLVRGRLKSQEDVWLVRSFVQIYRPMLDFFLRVPDAIVGITGLFLLVALPIFPPKVPWIFFVAGVPFVVAISVLLVARHKLACLSVLFCAAVASFATLRPLGEEFMPPLDELSIMDMPVTTPNANITQVTDDLLARNAQVRRFPEVHQVVGKAGRAETPTDPAPIDMVETVVNLRPKTWWPRRKIRWEDALPLADAAIDALAARGWIEAPPTGERADFANGVTMEALVRAERTLRELALQRLSENVPQKGRALVRRLRNRVVEQLSLRRAMRGEVPATRWLALEEELTGRYARAFDEWILREDVDRAVRSVIEFLVLEGAVTPAPDLLLDPVTWLSQAGDRLRALTGKDKSGFETRVRVDLDEHQDTLMRERIRLLDWELQDRAPGALSWFLIEELLAQSGPRGWRRREPAADELHALRAELEQGRAAAFYLWQKEKADLVKEMDSELQVPGWGNIWTQPIINRVDMLATGVRTMIGVKVFGPRLEDERVRSVVDGREVEQVEKGIQTVANEIAAVLRQVPGAVDVFPDQIVGENYLEIEIDRKRAARYGVTVKSIQDVIEVALGGKEITMTVEGRERYPVRVRYPREWRVDEELVRRILVPASGGMSTREQRREGMSGLDPKAMSGALQATPELRLRQVPLSSVAEVRVVPGPSMIKSEDGNLRAYVQLNVRDRDIVGFVEDARRAVEEKVSLPTGFSVAWSGQFEHQVRAQRTLSLVFPLVLAVIFVMLYLTYRDFADTFMMFLAVPGAVAGGALFQLLWGYNFSVAVWVGYIACFGLATETGIVMLVYLREAIDRRGGMERIRSEQEIHDAVMEGAVQRLRPKLLTEGTTVLALIPMLWATGVGAEFMRPMAVPILGGILVADEVIDIFIPVLFYWDRCRRLRRRREQEREPESKRFAAGDDPVQWMLEEPPPTGGRGDATSSRFVFRCATCGSEADSTAACCGRPRVAALP